MPSFFIPLKSCVFDPESSGGTCGSADDLVHILGKRKEGSGVSEKISKASSAKNRPQSCLMR
jgi:hypothetical protein